MKKVHVTILLLLTLFIGAAASYGSPPSIYNPFVVKSYRVYPAPEIDKWSTIEITVKCEGESEQSLRLFVNASDIELDLPIPTDVPDSELKSMRHGVPYPVAMSGKVGQLPTWKNMSKGAERVYSFHFRPYWYGKLGIDILNVGFIYIIGIGNDGKSTFAGTGGELAAIIGKPTTPRQGDQESLTYSDEQYAKQEKLLPRRKPGLQLDSTDTQFVLSGLSPVDILRQDYYIPRNLTKGETCKISIRILSRSRENEMPSFVPTGATDCTPVVFKGNAVVFGKARDGYRTGTIEITTTEDDLQAVLFRVLYPWTKEGNIDQMPIYGVRLHFGSNGKLISVQ